MRSKPSSQKSPHKATAGFSLIELLVVLFISGLLMAMMSGTFSASVNTQYRMGLHIETQQGLRALLEMVTQELRQAGACLPEQGQFISLDGVNSGDQDGLTLRIGGVDPDTLVCIIASTTVASLDESTTLTVADGTIFAQSKLVYVTPDGANGGFYTVEGTTATTVTLNEGLNGDHPLGTGIYAVEERIYAIDTITYGRPVLTVAIDAGTPQPMVDGVEKFNVQYLLAPCPPCNAVDRPANNTEWSQVREVTIDARVRSNKANKTGAFVYDNGQVNVKPRNLL